MPERYAWAEVVAQLQKLSERLPAGEKLDLMVFGSAALQHWGMENRLTRDVDVQMSKSSTNLEQLIGMLTPDVQMRDHAGPEPEKPYVEVMPASEDYTQPEFSVAEVLEISSNLRLLFPTPAEIAASKLAFVQEPDRVRDVFDIQFCEKRLGATRADIESSINTIPGESVRFWARMNLHDIDKVYREVAMLAERAMMRSRPPG
jgi:hypothetical protein